MKPGNEWWKKKPVYRDRYGLAPVMSNSDSLTPKSVLSSKFIVQFQDYGNKTDFGVSINSLQAFSLWTCLKVL